MKVLWWAVAGLGLASALHAQDVPMPALGQLRPSTDWEVADYSFCRGIAHSTKIETDEFKGTTSTSAAVRRQRGEDRRQLLYNAYHDDANGPVLVVTSSNMREAPQVAVAYLRGGIQLDAELLKRDTDCRLGRGGCWLGFASILMDAQFFEALTSSRTVSFQVSWGNGVDDVYHVPSPYVFGFLEKADPTLATCPPVPESTMRLDTVMRPSLVLPNAFAPPSPRR